MRDLGHERYFVLGRDRGNYIAFRSVADQGDLPSAIHLYERARSAATSSGLFTEEFDVRSHQLRGNLPQAFVHALFIETAMRLSPAFAPADPAPVNTDHEEDS